MLQTFLPKLGREITYLSGSLLGKCAWHKNNTYLCGAEVSGYIGGYSKFLLASIQGTKLRLFEGISIIWIYEIIT